MIKKIFSIIIVCCLVVVSAACNYSPQNESSPPASESETTGSSATTVAGSLTEESSVSPSSSDSSESTTEPVPSVTETSAETEPETVPETIAETVISIAPTEVLQGDYLTVYITNAGTGDKIEYDTKLAPNWMIKTIPFDGGFLALVPIAWDKAPAEYNFGVKVTRDGQIAAEELRVVKVGKKDFQKHYIVVSEELAATRSDENFAKDGVYTSKARSATASEPLWEGEFIMPVVGARITSDYGMIRYVNNVEVGRHSGLDVSIEAGAPVMASNGGRVTLAMELIVTGNTIIIDHGMNIFTAYCHLSKMFVETGDAVAKGDVIGEVGSTGFSTGPHLHWTFTIGETFVSPWLFMEKDPLDWLGIK